MTVFSGGIRGNDVQVRLKYADIPSAVVSDADDLLARIAGVPKEQNAYFIANYTALPSVHAALTAAAAAADGATASVPAPAPGSALAPGSAPAFGSTPASDSAPAFGGASVSGGVPASGSVPASASDAPALDAAGGLERSPLFPRRRVIARTPHPLPHLSLRPHPARRVARAGAFPQRRGKRPRRLLRPNGSRRSRLRSHQRRPRRCRLCGTPRRHRASLPRSAQPVRRRGNVRVLGAAAALARHSGGGSPGEPWRIDRSGRRRSRVFWAVAPTASSALHRASSCACATSFARTWRTAACCWPSAGAIRSSGESGCLATKCGGLGIVDMTTERAAGGSADRLIDNIVLRSPLATLRWWATRTMRAARASGRVSRRSDRWRRQRAMATTRSTKPMASATRTSWAPTCTGRFWRRTPKWPTICSLARSSATRDLVRSGIAAPALAPLDDSVEKSANEVLCKRFGAR